MIATFLGWRRRDEPFEWRQYVRTTIKLRREARRDKAERVKQHAVEGAKAAGVAAGGAARHGARHLGAGSRLAASGLGRGLGAMFGFLAMTLRGLWRGIVQLLEPLLAVLARPNIGKPLAIGGATLLVLGAGRAYLLKGLDAQVSMAVNVGGIALMLALLPRLLLGRGAGLPGPLARFAPAVFGLAACGLVGAAVTTNPGASSGWRNWPTLSLAAMPTLGSLTAALPFASTAQIIEGRGAVVGADLVRVGNAVVRLDGIDAPAREQVCTGARNKRWRCNDTAVQALAKLVNGRPLKCETRGKDAAGNAQGTCMDGAKDIGAELVKGGHVFAATGFLARYASAETEARSTKLGLWSGDNERPAEWRAKMWADAKKRAPQGCPIKGQVAGAARTYVLPWSAEYERVRVVEARGGRWFCSEDEAIAAGWKGSGKG